MPLFGSQSPQLDGLTRDEERKRDLLNQELLAVSLRQPTRSALEIDLELLRHKMSVEPKQFLWPFLYCFIVMNTGQFEEAEKAALVTKQLRPRDVRASYALATVYYTAASSTRGFFKIVDGVLIAEDDFDAKVAAGKNWPVGIVRLGITLFELYQRALEEFKKSYLLAKTDSDRELVKSSIDVIELLLASNAEKMTHGKYCPQCGQLLIEGAKFCTNCGAAQPRPS